jgi:hypothetical protein
MTRRQTFPKICKPAAQAGGPERCEVLGHSPGHRDSGAPTDSNYRAFFQRFSSPRADHDALHKSPLIMTMRPFNFGLQ